jgi:hypothetical protein
MGASCSIHGRTQQKNKTFLVSVDRYALHSVPVRFEDELYIRVLRNKQPLTKNGAHITKAAEKVKHEVLNSSLGRDTKKAQVS